jgi:nucleolar protein 56
MEAYCKNLKTVAGISIGAKLIEHAGSLRRLVMLPSSTIQILGAEKALFRHIKTGARPPKYGLIFEHKFVQAGKKPDQGKRARALADKISISVRLDYFHGEFMGDKMNAQLEEKFK